MDVVSDSGLSLYTTVGRKCIIERSRDGTEALIAMTRMLAWASRVLSCDVSFRVRHWVITGLASDVVRGSDLPGCLAEAPEDSLRAWVDYASRL